MNINDGLKEAEIAPWSTLVGYVELRYNWPWDALCATVISTDPVHSLIFSSGLRPPLEPPTTKPASGGQTIEGMWWKQEPGVSASVSPSNISDNVVRANIETNAGANRLGIHNVSVSPHGTKVVELSEVESTAANVGGIEVTYEAAAGSLFVNGSLQDEATGYSASLRFGPRPDTPAPVEQYSYAELGLMTGAADTMMQFPAGTIFTPYSILRNLAGQSISVTPTIYWMKGGAPQQAQLAPIQLQPLQTARLDLERLLAQGELGNVNSSFNLILTVKGPRHALLMQAGSVDRKNTYVFEVVPSLILESAAKTLSYWSTGNGDDTMVTLWNPADEAQDLLFTMFFAGGHYRFRYTCRQRVRAPSTFRKSSKPRLRTTKATSCPVPFTKEAPKSLARKARTNTFWSPWMSASTTCGRQPARLSASPVRGLSVLRSRRILSPPRSAVRPN